MVYYFLLKADPLLKGALFQEQQGGCLEGLERSWYPGPKPVGWGGGGSRQESGEASPGCRTGLLVCTEAGHTLPGAGLEPT